MKKIINPEIDIFERWFMIVPYLNVTRNTGYRRILDIFHIGYPYQNVVGALAKMFPNVWIDMCRAHAISPEASVRAIFE